MQGVFIFKRKSSNAVEASPKKKARRKSSKRKSEVELTSSFCHFGHEKKGLGQFRANRFRLYQDLSEKISCVMAEQQKETFGKVLADVQSFVRLIYTSFLNIIVKSIQQTQAGRHLRLFSRLYSYSKFRLKIAA